MSLEHKENDQERGSELLETNDRKETSKPLGKFRLILGIFAHISIIEGSPLWEESHLDCIISKKRKETD